MTTLFDGTVLPSFMKVIEGAGPTGTDLSLNDFRLHVGRIVAIHYPNNKQKFYEYDVEVDIGGGVKKVYPRCVMADPFGGFSDYVQWTPHLSRGTDATGSKTDYGSRVLVLCINGHSSRGVIIGGVKHHALPKEVLEDGHHFIAQFNGVRIGVNSAGELTLLRKGATFPDGSLVGDKDNDASIVLDEYGDIVLLVGKDLEDPEAMLRIDSQGLVLVDAKEEVRVSTNGNAVVKSAGLLVGDATDATMLAETYRAQEQILHNTIIPALIQLSALLATAGGATAAAGASLGAAGGLHVIPVVGPITASPAVVAAGTALATAGSSIAAAAPIVAQILAAIQTFEAMASKYLSTKNRND